MISEEHGNIHWRSDGPIADLPREKLLEVIEYLMRRNKENEDMIEKWRDLHAAGQRPDNRDLSWWERLWA